MRRIATVIIATLALLSIAAGGLLAAGCGGVPSDAVATVGGVSITKTQFQDLMSQAKAQTESQGMTFPEKGSATYDAYVAMLVDYLVQSEVVTQSASQFGVSVSDTEVADQITQYETTYGGEKKLLALLEQQGMTMAMLKQSIKDRALTQLVSTEVVAKATVSDSEIKTYWKTHAAELRKKKATATFAKAKSTIRETLLTQAKEKLWTAWLAERADELNVEYAAGYSPDELTASPSASASSSG